MQFFISALFTGYICVCVRVFVYIAGLGREQIDFTENWKIGVAG